MFNESVFAAPPLLKSLVSRWGCLHETVVLVHVRRVRSPCYLCGVLPVLVSRFQSPWAHVAVPVVVMHKRMLISKLLTQSTSGTL